MSVLRKLVSEVKSAHVTRDLSIMLYNTDPEAAQHIDRVSSLLQKNFASDIICLLGVKPSMIKGISTILPGYKAIHMFDSESVEYAPCMFVHEAADLTVEDDYYYPLEHSGYIVGADLTFGDIKFGVYTFALSNSSETCLNQIKSISSLASRADTNSILIGDIGIEQYRIGALRDLWCESGCCPEVRNNNKMGKTLTRTGRILYSQGKNGYTVVPQTFNVVHDILRISDYSSILGSFSYTKAIS